MKLELGISVDESGDVCDFDAVQNEKASILTGAYEYIEKLQRQVLELHDELDSESVCSDDEEDDVSSCEDDLNTEADSPLDFNAVFQGSGVECREDSCDMVSFFGLIASSITLLIMNMYGLQLSEWRDLSVTSEWCAGVG